ncbi:MAG: pilus assembly protein [Peptococcaceae bacterium]|nr:pilus assembly protein [Peptococcaceae bacterium]
MKEFAKDQRGQALVEFSLVFYLYMAIMLILVFHGIWLYNNFHADRAARHGALYLGTTNNAAQARTIAADYLLKTQVLSNTKNIRVYWSGQVPVCIVETEMRTFFPGIPKLFSSSNPFWTDKIQIVKEAVATGEHKYTNSSEYN